MSVDGDINEYIKTFAEDMSIYSVSLLPYFAHTEVVSHRIMILKIINKFYLDLGR
jgi:hypothetical protein